METLQRTANRGSISTGYDIENSLKLENDNAEQLYYTPSSAGNLKTWTYSCWIKRTELSYDMMLFGANDTYAYFVSDNTLLLRFTGTNNFRTARVFRDTSAWTHIVVAVDTTQATTADRIKIYFNGEDQTGLFASDTFPAQNTNTSWNNTLVHYVAGWATASFNPSCYLAEVYNIDGQKLEATDFGEFDTDTGIWKPKAYTGSYGTNGFHLAFGNSADLGEVSAGTQQNFVKSNITSADQATDTPTNNFATLNPLVSYYGSATINEGATKIQGTSTSSYETVYSTIAVTSGKWYFEVVNLLGSTRNTNFGIVNLDTAVFDGTSYNSAGFWFGNMDTGAALWYFKNGVSGGNESVTFSQGDIIGLAFDADNGTLDFYLNNSHQEQFTGIPSGTFAFLVEVQGTGAPYIQANFGGYTTISIASGASDANGYGTFEYAPPSGYYALCTKNLAEFG